MISPTTLLYALIGGILPALFWLWFWLREDRLHPEPRKFIMISFILGMIAVPLVIPLQHLASLYLIETSAILFAWAFIEEIAKFIAAYIGGIRRQAMDEPIDALIYLITPALGFAALENVLFILGPLSSGDIFLGFVTGNIRFIGTTLVHVVSSSIIGTAIALSFYRRQRVQIEYVTVGVFLAIALHALFNFFIIQTATGGVFVVFLGIWIAVVSVIIIFERVKRLTKSNIKPYG